jgi:hypothetical protein
MFLTLHASTKATAEEIFVLLNLIAEAIGGGTA